ncbi:arginine-binding periplasmic protein-like isoform X2 [Anneissia japonica]|uniref:arginine-binding periplasmic protein-like isoform X2 n=1 Tax=Anneissia japonica TaxID=1529436 RepID=UPI00142564B5|nr:arginine-binding periplasmic protein-like isoform X2 [Anneissia japonica]
MDGDLTAEILPTSKNQGAGGRSGLILVVIVTSCIISLLALVLSAVSLSNKGTTNINVPEKFSNSGSDDSSSDKIWTFAIGHDGTNLEYIDEISGTLRGFHVDLVNAVCEIANKNCVLMWDLYTNCWESNAGGLPRGGKGLMNSWYDACTGWFGTYERSRTFQFTDAFRKGFNGIFYVKSSNPNSFDPTNISGKKIGFLDGDATDEHCVARNSDRITGANILPKNIRHYVTPMQLSQAVISGEVDAGFTNSNILSAFTGLDKIGDEYSNCFYKGGAMMMRKDSSLASWWNPAFARLQETTKYKDICDKVAEVHGDRPGGDVSVICL